MLILTLLVRVQSGTATMDNTSAVSPKAEKTPQFHSWVNTVRNAVFTRRHVVGVHSRTFHNRKTLETTPK